MMITQLVKGLVELEVQGVDCLMSILGFHRVKPTDEELKAKYGHEQVDREQKGTQETIQRGKSCGQDM